MTPELGVFITPLLLLPGVALLIMSTMARYGQLHGEIHHLGGDHHGDVLVRARRLLRRGRLFQSALESLYLAVAGLAAASGLGGAVELLGRSGAPFVFGLTCVAILCVLFAATQLFRESRLSLEILEIHLEDLEAEGSTHE